MTRTGDNGWYGTVVVGYDGTDQAEDGLALGVELAQLRHARLVVAFAYAGESIPVGIGSASLGLSMREEAAAVLARGVRRVPEGVHVRGVALRGASPARALQELAETEGADLVVLGPAQYGPVGRVLIGSVGARLLNGLPCPVAVAPRGYAFGEHSIKRIGVCWNGSREAAAAVRPAVSVARTAGADLYFTHVIDPTEYVHVPLPAVFAPNYEEITSAAEEALAAALGELPNDVRASAQVLVGTPAATLVENAGTQKLDLLVTGSRGYGPLRRVLLGGMSAKLMHSAPCPVLIVPNTATHGRRRSTERAEAAAPTHP